LIWAKTLGFGSYPPWPGATSSRGVKGVHDPAYCSTTIGSETDFKKVKIPFKIRNIAIQNNKGI